MSHIPPSPKTPAELMALPELTGDPDVFLIRPTDGDAVFLFRHGERVFAPVYVHGKWWKREQYVVTPRYSR